MCSIIHYGNINKDPTTYQYICVSVTTCRFLVVLIREFQQQTRPLMALPCTNVGNSSMLCMLCENYIINNIMLYNMSHAVGNWPYRKFQPQTYPMMALPSMSVTDSSSLWCVLCENYLLAQACQTCVPCTTCRQTSTNLRPTQRILISSLNGQNCSCGPHDNTYMTYVAQMAPSVWHAYSKQLPQLTRSLMALPSTNCLMLLVVV